MHSISRFLAFFLLILCCFMTEQRALAADAAAPQEPATTTEKPKQDNAAPAGVSPARSADTTTAPAARRLNGHRFQAVLHCAMLRGTII